jgi:hypothetical protein
MRWLLLLVIPPLLTVTVFQSSSARYESPIASQPAVPNTPLPVSTPPVPSVPSSPPDSSGADPNSSSSTASPSLAPTALCNLWTNDGEGTCICHDLRLGFSWIVNCND